MEATTPDYQSLPSDETACFLMPVLRHFENKPYHVHSATVRWNKPRLVMEFNAQLLRSKAGHCWDEDVPPSVHHCELLFHLPCEVFVHPDEDTASVHAACPPWPRRCLRI